MIPIEEWNAIQARRALLRQQTRLVGPRLRWLADPALIPEAAVDQSIAPGDVHLAAFSLAAWMLIEIVRAADQVHQELDWEQALDRYRVVPRLRESVSRAVLCPASRHAPGLFAIAEIISVVPVVASRSGMTREHWQEIARQAEAFGAALAHDGTAVQVLIRNYLSRDDGQTDGEGVRSLNPARLKLDGETGLTTVTPLEELLSAARGAAARHLRSYRTTCVALRAPAPGAVDGTGATSMFGAVWSSFAATAHRLVFPRYDPRDDLVPTEAKPDPECEDAFERLAAARCGALSQATAHRYPPTVERILDNLLAAAHSRADDAKRHLSPP